MHGDGVHLAVPDVSQGGPGLIEIVWIYDEAKKKKYFVSPTTGRKIYSEEHARFLQHVSSVMEEHGIGEFPFDSERKWSFDWAWPELRIAVEYEGNVYGGGKGHRSVGKFVRDMEKYNWAAIYGWCVLRCASVQINDGTFYGQLEAAIQRRVEERF